MTYENFVQVLLAEALTDSADSALIASPGGAYRLPPETGGVLVLADSAGAPAYTEIISYTSRTGNTLNGLVRAQEGTEARAWPVGSFCYQSLTAEMLQSTLIEPHKFPSIRPSLRLDFANNPRLDPRVTFTRASGGGRFNAQGQYEWVGPNEPRIDYDPVTGECKGLLVEEQRTNIIPYSEDFTSGLWTRSNATIDSVTTTEKGKTQRVRLDGLATADRVAIYIPTTAGVSYTVSVCIRAVEGMTAGRVILEGGGVGSSIVMHVPPTEKDWKTYSATFVSLGGSVLFSVIRCVGELQGSTVFDVAQVQVEEGSFPTSYIPTNGAAVTRAADNASAYISSWYNQSGGALLAEFSSANATNFEFDGGYSADRFGLSIGYPNATSISGFSLKEGSRFATVSGYTANVTSRAVFAYWGKEFGVSFGGSAVAKNTALSLPPVSRLTLGFNAVSSKDYANGHIKRLEYYPRALSDTELQRLTAND